MSALKKASKIIIILIILLLISVIISLLYKSMPAVPPTQNQNSSSSNGPALSTSTAIIAASTGSANNSISASSASATIAADYLDPPIISAKSRVTKKPFGLYVSPGHSPVSPEKFTGFHTGVDFETSPDEAKTDVPILAVCTGNLLLKKWASGYGGVAVESCSLNSQPITIIYGHLKLSSITIHVGQKISAGDRIGILGQGYSTETDGERKHLHLGIHKGTAINILGYVDKSSQLSGWLNILDYLK